MILKVISTGSKSTAGNCYALFSNSGQILLLDFGCDKKKILKGINYKISNVVGAFLSHEHGDHSKSYKWLFDNWIPIYCNDETAKNFEIITGEKMVSILDKKWKQCGEFWIMPFYLPHTTFDKYTKKLAPCPNYGYLIQHEEMGRLIYMTDMRLCPYNFKNLHINHFLMECNYCDDLVDSAAENYRHRLYGHCSLETCKGIVEANKTPDLQTIILIHLSDAACDPNRVLNEINGIAEGGIKVNIAVPGLYMELKKVSI